MTQAMALLTLALGTVALAAPSGESLSKYAEASREPHQALGKIRAENEIYKTGWTKLGKELESAYAFETNFANASMHGDYVYRHAVSFVKDDKLESQGDVEILYFPFLGGTHGDQGHLNVQITITTPLSEPPLVDQIGDFCKNDKSEQGNKLICNMLTPINLASDFTVTLSLIENSEWNFFSLYWPTESTVPAFGNIANFKAPKDTQYLSYNGEVSAYSVMKEESCDRLNKSIVKYTVEATSKVIFENVQGIPDSPCYGKDSLTAEGDPDYNIVVRRGNF